MSYAKAMRHSVRKSKKQANNHFGFSTLAANERRRRPWLGSSWLEPGKEEELAAYLVEWDRETERLRKANPKLVIID